MRGPKSTATVAHRKLSPDSTKKTKVDKSMSKKENAATKNFGAPKRPPSAFFIFMEQFRKDNKENFPENKSASAISQEGGVIWNSMSDFEKAPYVAKSAKKKAEYEIAIKQHNDDLNETAMEKSGSSSLNTHDDVEQEASSQVIC